MARRNGWVACAIGLHCCVLAGCLHTDPRPANATGPANPPSAVVENPPAPHSPYTIRSTERPFDDRKPLELPKPAVDADFKRTSQPAADKPPATAETTAARPPQPLPLAPTPAPNWLTTEAVAPPATNWTEPALS